MKSLSLLLIITLTHFSCTSSNKDDHSASEKNDDPISEQMDKENEIISTEEEDFNNTLTQSEAEKVLNENSTENTQTERSTKPPMVSESDNNVSTTNLELAVVTQQKKAVEELVEKISIHAIYNNLLSKYVSSKGAVNYTGLKKEHSSLKGYIESLKKLNHKTLPKNDQLAFLINFYNALTLDLILKNHPLKSITDLPKAWDTPRVTYQGKSLTLNNIEHQLIRENFKEPRIHFACNCAAKSCPKLLNKAYEGATLEKQLDSQTKLFLNNTSKNSLSANSIKISKIFEWYGKDFGNVTLFIKKYHPEVNSNAKISYLEYDWTLNKQ
jgi:hypothetical protein